MTDGSWRLATPGDLPFLYELVTLVDPRWWRFSRHGLEPGAVFALVQTISAGAIVLDESRRPVAAAALADSGATGTGTLEFFARPDTSSQALARRFAPEIVAAAFAGAPVRRLYRERFEGDADVYGVVNEWFETEVVYPTYALVDGRYESRTIDVLTDTRFAELHATHLAEGAT
jgi:hypothetical protein